MAKAFRVCWLHDGISSGEAYGNHLQRVLRPCELWSGDGEFDVEAVAITEPHALATALEVDLLVVVQLANVPVGSLIRERRRLGRPSLYEINDDISQVGDWIPANSISRSPLRWQQVFNAASACDALQLASEGQSRRFAALHAERHVLDPHVPVPDEMPEKPADFVVGWAGTNTHRDNLLAVAPALARFLHRHPDARFALMGDLDYLQPVLGQLPSAQVQVRPFGSYADLQHFLAGIHVGIAPLTDTGFNRSRSDGKFAQYAAAGAVPLLADCAVFAPHRRRARLFSSPQDMLAQLQALHADRRGLSAMAAEAFAWVREQRSPDAIREILRQRFRRLLGHRPPLPRKRRDAVPPLLSAHLANARQAAGNGHDEDCLAYCRQALALQPDCHAARWLAASTLSRLKRYPEVLSLVDQAPCDRVYAEHYAALAHAAARQACPARQEEFLRRIESPARRCRLLGGQPGAMETHYRTLLGEDPYDYFALFGLIALLRTRAPQHDDLPLLMQRADLLAPAAAPTLR